MKRCLQAPSQSATSHSPPSQSASSPSPLPQSVQKEDVMDLHDQHGLLRQPLSSQVSVIHHVPCSALKIWHALLLCATSVGIVLDWWYCQTACFPKLHTRQYNFSSCNKDSNIVAMADSAAQMLLLRTSSCRLVQS